MALVNLKILGIKMSDNISFKIIIGGICIALLLLMLGPDEFYDWTVTSLLTYIGTILIIVSVTEFFISGDILSTRATMLAIIGIALILVSCTRTDASLYDTGVAIVKAFVWATIFSILIDTGKKHARKVEQKVKKFIDPQATNHEAIVNKQTGQIYKEEWMAKINKETNPVLRQRPYQKS